MSDDIVERLRESDGYRVVRADKTWDAPRIVADTALIREAADEIERLRAALREVAEVLTEDLLNYADEIERLRAALRKITQHTRASGWREIARRALKGTE